MRVAILGIGGVGRTLVSELRSDARVDGLLLVDKMGERARVLAGMRGRVPIEAREIAVDSRPAIARAIRGYDVVVNATLPKFNDAIMSAALDAGVHYVDVAATGPVEPGGQWGILAQLDRADAFRSAGLTALLSMGLDPGMSNVLARALADELDSVDAVRIRSGGSAKLPGFGAFPLYSREAFLSDVLIAPTVWADGRLQEREPMGEEESFEFPEPVGAQRVFLMSHEEVKTVPRFLGKPVGRVDFKYGLDPHLVRAVLSLEKLGFLEDGRVVRIGGQNVPFRRALIAAFPEPSALVLPLEGTKALAVEVEGERAGARKVLRADIAMAHSEANRRRSTTAVYYLTAAAAAIGAVLVGEGALPGPGVFTSETLPHDRVFAEWRARDLPLVRSEGPATVPGSTAAA
jgi:saccharopine dehydrogenase (NAD+, L-lysine-forming)